MFMAHLVGDFHQTYRPDVDILLMSFANRKIGHSHIILMRC